MTAVASASGPSLCNLYSVEGGTLAEIVTRYEQRYSVLKDRVWSDPPDTCVVLPGRLQWRRNIVQDHTGGGG